MHKIYKYFRINNLLWLLIFVLCNIHYIKAQVTKDSTFISNQKVNYNFKQFIIPTVLISYGVVGLNNHQLKFFNSGINQEVIENIDEKVSLDDFLQYTPAATPFALELIGVKGKSSIKKKIIILSTSYLLMGASVETLKQTTHQLRPDGSDYLSFPSGHTATAFMGAEFLYQEYKDISIWYGISGYFLASVTGTYRMLNNKHWLTDVVAGAGIGILSTKLSYIIYPIIEKTFFHNKNNYTSIISPYYNNQSVGLNFIKSF